MRSYNFDKIIFTEHALLRAKIRNIKIDDVKRELTNPKELYYFEEQEAEFPNEKKFNLYFKHSNNYNHRYVIVINDKCIVVTVIRINKKIQRKVDKNANI